jgi:hypothetical protein
MDISVIKDAVKTLAATLAVLLLAVAVVALLWYGMWKLAFEPNPIIREFFDLDKKKNTINEINSKKKTTTTTTTTKRRDKSADQKEK